MHGYNRHKATKESVEGMVFDELFEQRKIVASKLKNYIRDAGYTKISFANKVNISRPTLDRLLNGDVDNKCTYDKHLRKILDVLGMNAENLMLYHCKENKADTVVYSKNMPENYEMSTKAKKQMDLLLDLVDLCTIYY